eukprot:gene7729-biopygen21073
MRPGAIPSARGRRHRHSPVSPDIKKARRQYVAVPTNTRQLTASDGCFELSQVNGACPEARRCDALRALRFPAPTVLLLFGLLMLSLHRPKMW